MGRVLATIDTQKNSVVFFMLKKQTLDFQERNGTAAFSFYTITFSRCKPFSLGSHLLDYYEYKVS